MSVGPALRKQRQEAAECEASLGYVLWLSLCMNIVLVTVATWLPGAEGTCEIQPSFDHKKRSMKGTSVGVALHISSVMAWDVYVTLGRDSSTLSVE